MNSMTPKVLAIGVIAAGLAFGATLNAQERPGFSTIDRTDITKSKQDPKLKGNPQPPTATPLEKIPVGRAKLPAGFKAEIWSHGHAAARTMVMGSKGTMFMGTRVIGRVYAITEKDGKREAKV